MRKTVIAGNWKMHMTCASAREYMETFIPLSESFPFDRNIVIAPPFTAISTLSLELKGTKINLSSQNIRKYITQYFKKK